MSFEPPVRYVLSPSDSGIEQIDLSQPLRSGRSLDELTLGDYFEAVKNFVLRENDQVLVEIISRRLNKPVNLRNIKEVLICSEKHGALYHVASVEIFVEEWRVKFAVSTAVSEIGKEWMNQEFDTINFLNNTFGLSFLPKAYFKSDVICRNKLVRMFLSDWLEDYHEWHLSMDGKKQRIIIWDLQNGYRFASKKESLQIYRQASKILTLYYNTRDFSQVYPWHHAAGDFVVKVSDGAVEVKLTTARKYGPVMVFLTEDTVNPLVALIYFFLNLTAKMRLDKFDGIGEVAWAEAFCLKAVLEGFFEALRIKEEEGSYYLGRVEDLYLLFKTFSQDELRVLFYSLLDLYRMHDPADFLVIKANLDDHAAQLYSTIQDFCL